MVYLLNLLVAVSINGGGFQNAPMDDYFSVSAHDACVVAPAETETFETYTEVYEVHEDFALMCEH